MADQLIHGEASIFNAPETFVEVSDGGNISFTSAFNIFDQRFKDVRKCKLKRKERHGNTQQSTPLATQYNGDLHTLKAPKGSVNLSYPHIKGKMIIDAIDGIVKLAGAYSLHYSELITQSSDAFWMSGDLESTTQKIYHNPNIEGEVSVHAKELHLELARQTYRDVLDKITTNPDCKMEQLLQDDVFEHLSKELYSTPSQGLTLMVGIAAAIATYGVASGWGAAAAKGLTGLTATATHAAVMGTTMALSSLAAILLVKNKGDLSAFQRELFSTQTVIDLTKTATAAVLTVGIASSIGAAPTMPHLQEALKSSTGFSQSHKTIGGYMISSSAAHFMVDTTQSLIERKINGNILLKSGLNAVHSAGIETVASSLCHQSGVMFPQGTRTFLDQVTHKLAHGLTAASASVFMGNPDAALASALGAVVGEMAIETLDAMDQKPTKSMTPQERKAIEKVKAQKELDQKTNTSLFKMAIKKRDIANLATALFLTLTTPYHLVAEAYQAAQRAMDFNHDVSVLRAKDQEVQEEIEEPVKEIPHDHEEGTITLQCTEKEYEVYNAKYERWKARDEVYQREINESGELKKAFVETKRAWNRLYHRPNTPPRKVGNWSEGKVKEGLQKGMGKVSGLSSQFKQSHAQDFQNLKSDPLNATNLLKAPSMLTNELLGQGLYLMGEVVTPIVDKTTSVARQILRSQGISPQVASDVVYGFETATIIYGGVKGVSSLAKATRASKAVKVNTVIQPTQLRTVEALGLDVPYISPHNMTHGVSKNFASLQANMKATRVERLSRQEGLAKMKAIPEGQALELSHNVGSRQAFDRKITALQDLADRGKLVKTKSVRDPRVTEKYRDGLLDRVEREWGIIDPAKADRMTKVVKDMHADHVHELQLGGLDHRSMLSMLDPSVNTSVGSQIRHQLAKMPDGTVITQVIEKGSK